jgi:hypothetical protein
MCRIWINGVPPGHQPAPTSCETAVRNQPPNSQIIWGDKTNRDRDGYDRDRHDRDRDYDRDRDSDRNNDRRQDRDRNRDDGHQRDANGNHPGNTGSYPGNNNGGYDRGQYPANMPAMTGASLIRVGVRSADVQNWLGRGSLRSETQDSNGDGVPEVATWYDGNGNVVQVWRDNNRDGRADEVDIYQNGRRVQTIR